MKLPVQYTVHLSETVWIKKLHFKMHSDTSHYLHCTCIQSINKAVLNKLLYSSVNNKYPSFRQANFPIRTKFPIPTDNFFFWGGR